MSSHPANPPGTTTTTTILTSRQQVLALIEERTREIRAFEGWWSGAETGIPTRGALPHAGVPSPPATTTSPARLAGGGMAQLAGISQPLVASLQQQLGSLQRRHEELLAVHRDTERRVASLARELERKDLLLQGHKTLPPAGGGGGGRAPAQGAPAHAHPRPRPQQQAPVGEFGGGPARRALAASTEQLQELPQNQQQQPRQRRNALSLPGYGAYPEGHPHQQHPHDPTSTIHSTETLAFVGKSEIKRLLEQQQVLVVELDALRKFRDENAGLVGNIYQAFEQGKICIVTLSGCVATTMEQLKKQLFEGGVVA
jgi:hypothetical protein